MVNHRLFFCAVLVLFTAMSFSYRKPVQKNHAPSVKIITPSNRAAIKPGTMLSYEISVSDPEDGDSKYDEINAKEVLLEVKYISGNPGVKSAPVEAPGLTVMAVSNCFNCHNFNGKAIGPSFFEISKRYPFTRINTDTLANRIKSGSSGIWGKEKMPSHPELTAVQIKTMVQWILKNAAVRDISYYNGLSGLIQFPANRKGIYVLTASYTDHGIPGISAKPLCGFDRITLER